MSPSVPDNIKYYIDYEKFAHDCQLSGDMYEFEYNGKTYTCTNSSGLWVTYSNHANDFTSH